MQESANYQELAKRYGLAPLPESVSQLTQLIARQDAEMDQIAALISKDPGLKARILRVANPRAEHESEYTIETVEDALMRNGIGCVLLIAMGTPLAQALVKAFQTMLSLKLDTINVHDAPELSGEHILGTIGFSGKALGRVYLRMSLDSGKKIAGTILGLDASELNDFLEVKDVIGEVLNIMTGNFKSNLCDAGLDCRLETPDVKLTDDRQTPTIRGGGLERMAFRSGDIVLFVDVTVNPWND
ncbi:MAG TPA: chemotaxis protein CheX [Verrucomicrobiae bacterium]|nr:chemotaxis protein CheX [Verrucomicrobiae bacterium]